MSRTGTVRLDRIVGAVIATALAATLASAQILEAPNRLAQQARVSAPARTYESPGLVAASEEPNGGNVSCDACRCLQEEPCVMHAVKPDATRLVPFISVGGASSGVVDREKLEASPHGSDASRSLVAGRTSSYAWAPLQPSTRSMVDRARLFAAMGKPAGSLGDVSDFLHGALVDGGYRVAYLLSPGGFVLLTWLEQIDARGAPKPGVARYAVPRGRGVSGALLGEPHGRYRVIALVVSDAPVRPDAPTAGISAMADLWAEAADMLPIEMRGRPYTEMHDVTVLIYEFEERNSDRPADFIDESRHEARKHLAHTRIAGLLQ